MVSSFHRLLLPTNERNYLPKPNSTATCVAVVVFEEEVIVDDDVVVLFFFAAGGAVGVVVVTHDEIGLILFFNKGFFTAAVAFLTSIFNGGAADVANFRTAGFSFVKGFLTGVVVAAATTRIEKRPF